MSKKKNESKEKGFMDMLKDFFSCGGISCCEGGGIDHAELKIGGTSTKHEIQKQIGKQSIVHQDNILNINFTLANDSQVDLGSIIEQLSNHNTPKNSQNTPKSSQRCIKKDLNGKDQYSKSQFQKLSEQNEGLDEIHKIHGYDRQKAIFIDQKLIGNEDEME